MTNSSSVKAFGPRMEASISGFSVVGELKWRAWSGIVADLWEVDCADGARGDYVAADPRLFIPVAASGSGAFVLGDGRTSRAYGAPLGDAFSYVPAGHPTHGTVSGTMRLRHLDMHISVAGLTRRFGRALPVKVLDEPRLSIEDDRVWTLAQMMARALGSDESSHDLYFDGLANAMLCALFDIGPDQTRRGPALSRKQLQVALEYIDVHCADVLRLSDLARLVGVSDTYFSHAFKAATGVPPHRFVMQERIRKAQALIAARPISLVEVAAQCGFSDQAHFNRVFRSVTGLTPAAWRREHASHRSDNFAS